jgi:siroheme synthase-like protein
MVGFPVLFNVSGRLAVVVGGGEVALRKVRNFLERGARLKVVSPALCPELSRLAEENDVETALRPYQKGDLTGAVLCAACADDPAVNRQVRDHARELGVPANIADDPQGSDYQVPSYFQQGPLVLALSTSGASPAVARTLRRMIESYLGESMGEAIELVNRFREEKVKKEIDSPAERGRFWENAVDAGLLELARAGDLEQMEERLLKSLQEWKAGKNENA